MNRQTHSNQHQNYDRWKNAQKRRRRKAERRRQLAIAAGCGGALILAGGILFALRNLKADRSADNVQTETTTEAQLPDNPTTVNGISVEGMELDEAVRAVTKDYDWKLSAELSGERVELPDLVEARAREYLETICGKQDGGSYQFDLTDIAEAAKAEAAKLAEQWDQAPVDSVMNGYDADKDKFLFSESKNGRSVDQEALVSLIVSAVKEGRLSETLDVPVKTEAAKDADTVRNQYELLASFTTDTTANEKRNTNVRLSADALNGTVVKSGAEFSFNKVIGPRTAEKGYQVAAAYNGGEVVQEVGGGVCQISSTLYRVAFQAGMNITYRRSHTFEPNYVTPGQDATISWDMPDFRFVNTSKAPIGIRASYANRKATVAIYGIPVLEKGVTWDLYSEKTKDGEIPEPTYVEDETLAPGTEKIKSAGSKGSTWVTYKIVYQDGKEVSRTKDHEKIYKGHAPVILRNSGTTQKLPGETAETPETAASLPVDGMDDETGTRAPGQSAAQSAGTKTESGKKETEKSSETAAPTEATSAAKPAESEETGATAAYPGLTDPALDETPPDMG